MKSSVIVVFFTLLSFSTSTVYADAYIGVGAGLTFYDVDLSELGGGNFDDDVTSAKFYAGYAFNDYFAAEATYYSFADASVGSVETPSGLVGADASVDGIAAFAVGMYPVSKRVNLMLKLGVLDWDADISVNDTSGSNDGTDIVYAVGVSYALSKALLVVAEWESFDTDNPELDMLSFGFKAIFR